MDARRGAPSGRSQTGRSAAELRRCLKKNTNISISLSYFSKSEERKLHIYSKNLEIYADFLLNKLTIIKNNKRIKYEYNNYSIDSSYLTIHNKIFKKNFTDICDLKTGNKLAKIFSIID